MTPFMRKLTILSRRLEINDIRDEVTFGFLKYGKHDVKHWLELDEVKFTTEIKICVMHIANKLWKKIPTYK